METIGWIVILIVSLAFAAVIAWLGMLWMTSRMGKSMTEVFRTSVSREEIESIKREISQLRESIENLKHRSRR
jgi:pilus assembly protein TadC